ncbi:MAG: glycosyltransferase family 2 protein [Candidatus Binatia bacterium]
MWLESAFGSKEGDVKGQRRLPKVVVIILTWNGLDDLVTCLESFSCVEYADHEVLVVDNASEDDTVATVRARYPWVSLLVNDGNLGYVGGNNAGIRWALDRGADYVFVLNNDTKMTPDVLSRLVGVMETDPRIAVCGAKNLLMDDPSYTWGKYGRITWGPMLVKTVGRFEKDRPEPSPKDVEWVIGNGCLMRCQALEDVGVFDAAFFQANEDVDWSVRARQRGWRVVYVDDAAILHKGGASADRRKEVFFSYNYLLGRNAILFARKHADPLQWAKLFSLLVVGVLLRTSMHAAYLMYRTGRAQIQFAAGAIDGFRHRLQITDPEPVTRAMPLLDTPIGRLVRWLEGS